MLTLSFSKIQDPEDIIKTIDVTTYTLTDIKHVSFSLMWMKESGLCDPIEHQHISYVLQRRSIENIVFNIPGCSAAGGHDFVYHLRKARLIPQRPAIFCYHMSGDLSSKKYHVLSGCHCNMVVMGLYLDCNMIVFRL